MLQSTQIILICKNPIDSFFYCSFCFLNYNDFEVLIFFFSIHLFFCKNVVRKKKFFEFEEMNTSIPSGDAVGIQFGLITTEDVEKLADGQELGDLPQSVKKGVAAFNTVTSPLMGTQNASTLCGRCGGDLEHCQGHFCKLTLFQPICNANFFPVLPKVFASQCVRCSRLLVPDDHPRLAKSLKKANNYKHAVNATFADVQRYKICWFPPNISDSKKTKAAACKQRQQDNNNEPEDPEELPHMLSSEEARIRGYCGAKQPDMW